MILVQQVKFALTGFCRSLIFGLLILMSGCAVWDAGHTDNAPVSVYQASVDEKIPITYSVSMECERNDIIAMPDKASLSNKIGEALKATGLFSSVKYEDIGDYSYHVQFHFRQAGMTEAELAAVGLISGFTFLLIPTGETYTFDGTATLSFKGKEVYSSAKPEKLRVLIWLPLAPIGLFMNSWTAWNDIEEGTVNALVNDVAVYHRKKFSRETGIGLNDLKNTKGYEEGLSIEISQARTNVWNQERAKWDERHARNRFVSQLPSRVPDLCSDFRKVRRWQAIGLLDYELAQYNAREQEGLRDVRRGYGNDSDGFRLFAARYDSISRENRKRFREEREVICSREIALAYAEKLELDLMNAIEAYSVSRSEEDYKLIAGIFDEYPEVYASSDAKEIARKKFMAKVPVPRMPTQSEHSSSGTGWFVSSNKIVTCAHVVERAKTIGIELKDGTSASGRIFAIDSKLDIAIVEVACASAVVLPVSPTSEKLATHIFTIGYPMPGLLGKDQKYTEGTISSLSGLHDDREKYQVSVPLQPGNSGGAVVNDKGMVIGMASEVLDSLKGLEVGGVVPQNVNYVIKSRYITQMLEDYGIEFDSKSNDGVDMVDRTSRATVLIKVRK